jgi:hypothetical protein
MRRISGIDVNGWKDVAARDWEFEEPEQESELTKILDGGLGSVAVQQSSGVWIAGPQALLAPHGRGPGWGALGNTQRRISIASALEEFTSERSERFGTVYGAAVHALGRGADEVVLAIPDVGDYDEARRGEMLAIFYRDRRAVRLLWRPVAAFLHALESGKVPKDANGELFCFLIHSGTSIDLQTLRLRRDSEHSHHEAPERDGYGLGILQSIGMSRLRERANAAVLRANPQLSDGQCEDSMLGLRLICGAAIEGDTEVLRLHNGNWIEATAPKITDQDLFTSADFVQGIDFASYESISASFLVTPLAGHFATTLRNQLRAFFPNLTILESDAVARGSLRAGRLIEQGLPHYFDRLTPISLAIIKGDEPKFDDLVGSKATLPANKEYVSPPYRNLKWLAGKRDIEFYVLKGEDEVRYWNVHLEEPPKRDVTVELRLRQTPGQSWAKLSLTSPEWEPLQRSPIFLDWTKLGPINESPAEIIEKLRTPPPTIPMRIVESASLELWTGSSRFVGLTSGLHDAKREGRFKPEKIAGLLVRSLIDPNSRTRSWTVGTDGILPDQLADTDKTLFHQFISGCEKQIVAALSAGSLNSNGALRCLTWSFTLCPQNIQDEIIKALEADQSGQNHPFLQLRRARAVLTQGAGRAVTGVTRLRRLLANLASRPANNDTLSALAMILSRREEAPLALTPDLVDKIVGLMSLELIHLTEHLSFKVRFKNALSAIAGLFRYREIERYALLAGRDSTAQRLRKNLDEVDDLLFQHRSRVPKCEEKRTLISLIREYLDGAGDPNVLIRIEALDEQQEDSEA